MTTAQHLETIDLLRSRGFPAEPGPSDVGQEGPGFHIAELNGHFGDDADAEQRLAEHDALLDVLIERWGEPDLFSLASTQLRADGDEDVPDPWRRLSEQMGWLHLWRIEDLWIALGLSEFQLLAVVTDIDPL
ncbi:hypothetical protein [Streptomyces sp. NPDC005408]|uniref:hypothetical protein n=1 Tax=Streptomyces sp. NPDC005408 TaxID=3155341 RepID=UPI00339E8C4C